MPNDCKREAKPSSEVNGNIFYIPEDEHNAINREENGPKTI